jgi:hypothetical protein
MRILVLALMALMAAQAAAAETFCSAEKFDGQWEVSAGSKSYSLKTGVFLTVPEGAKVRFVEINPLLGYSYSMGTNTEFNYRSDGDVYFRTPALAVENAGSWVTLSAILKAQGKPLHVAFREPGGQVFASTPLGDQMADRLPTLFGILEAEQAAVLYDHLENGKPFDVLIATNDAIIAEKSAFTYPDFAGGKAAADGMFEELKAQAARGECM